VGLKQAAERGHPVSRANNLESILILGVNESSDAAWENSCCWNVRSSIASYLAEEKGREICVPLLFIGQERAPFARAEADAENRNGPPHEDPCRFLRDENTLKQIRPPVELFS
jgi:hypothetical protein